MAQKFNAMVSSYKDHFMERPSPSPLDTSAPTPLRLFDVLGENDPDLWNHSVTAAEHAASDGLARKRREAIRDGFLHAWRGYSSKAWGADEIRPRSGLPKDNWGGIGMTILDSLSTLWLLGLETDFSIARDWVANNLSFHSAKNVSTFETTIRGLGGLLSAHSLSGDGIFLFKAKELGEQILAATEQRDGWADGLPQRWASLNKAVPLVRRGRISSLAEVGSLQLELRELSARTGDRRFSIGANKISAWAYSKSSAWRSQLCGNKVDLQTGGCSGAAGFGGAADSFYEYLLKAWYQGGKREEGLREMYDRAIDGLVQQLVYRSARSGLAYIGTTSNGVDMEHLACFTPGLLALGAYGQRQSRRKRRDISLAHDLMETCWRMYADMPTGLGAEKVAFSASASQPDLAAAPSGPWTVLRPEMIESLFVMHAVTHDCKFRDWGWQVWVALNRYCRTTYGYGAFPDVRNGSKECCIGPDDRMETFVLAETFKYLFLLMDPDRSISLDTHVLNTEAHPFSIIGDNMPGFVPFVVR